jgi:hypothetical protein
MTRLLKLSGGLLPLLLAACTAPTVDGANDNLPDEDDLRGKEDGVERPVGTFRLEEAQAGEFTLLVLKTDKTFHSETMVYCFAAPCYPVALDGTYKYTRSGHTLYIRFQDLEGRDAGRFAYTYDGSTLSLRKTYTDTWFDMTLEASAWCGVPDDCGIQNLITPRCLGLWTCDAGVCAYDCTPPAMACTDAGGTCEPVTAAGCPAGSAPADASEYTCGPDGLLGVMCCLPEEAPNPCETAGGTCVGLRPDACPEGTAPASAEEYPCGPEGLLGVMCCLPEAACTPVCRANGTRSEGWYDGCTGELICFAQCDGAVAECGAIGSRSEGWYSAAGAPTGCGGGALIQWDQCAS